MECIRGWTLLITAFTGFSFVTFSDAACHRALLSSNVISHDERQKILDMHNSARQAIALGHINGQPAAANMLEMKWDDELAQRAQKWATSCLSEGHDPQRQTARFSLGQNIATFWTSRKPSNAHPDFSKAVNAWFKEGTKYRFSAIHGRATTGHYTQMVWAGTNLVGCGYTYYYDPSKGFTKNYICNYGPGGNVIAEQPYEKGYPHCSKYDLQKSKKWTGLCDKNCTTRN